MKVLVTGAKGQLGKTLEEYHTSFKNIEFVFSSRETLDITNEEDVDSFFSNNHFNYCINCAAYTNVEKAEQKSQKAFIVNAEAVKILAQACKKNAVVLIHVSTDYVFDGQKNKPYLEDDQTNPINVYGASKLKGEDYITSIMEEYYIVRTSWLYSDYGHNFVKTMLRLAQNHKKITVVDDQTSAPTYANDLAEVIMKIISKQTLNYGVYHYSNEGETSWYDFAKEIFNQLGLETEVIPISTEKYAGNTKRPLYSLLDSKKIKKHLEIELNPWKFSLTKSLKRIAS